MKIESAFLRLLQGRSLAQSESRQLFRQVFNQEIPEAKIKTLLLLLAEKGETAEELSGCLEALQSLEKSSVSPVAGLLDTCGTGGDGKGSINVSTLAAIVIAGAGGKVAKHGNRGISSRCGSSDLMEALGVNLSAKKSKMIQSLKKSGIGYFHAPFYHPVFSKMHPLRKKLKTRTIFNLLGPLANPFKLSARLVGVSNPKTLKLYAEVLKGINEKQALICHSQNGMDEISSECITDVAKISRRGIVWGKIDPKQLGFKSSKKKSPKIQSISQNKKAALQLLQNKLSGSGRDTVVLNAAAGLWISGKAKGLREGIQMADDSIRSGKAYRALQQLKKFSK